jgi:maleate isomerase
MSGWDRKLGYVVPSWNTVIEYETVRMLPAGVSAHFSRIAHTEDSTSALEYMSEVFPDHVDLLSHAGVNGVCYACTGASFLKGRQFDIDYIARHGRGDLIVTSMAGSIVEAATHLGLSRIAVAAPYEQWLLDLLVAYLEEAGFTITGAVGLNQQANVVHSPAKAIELAMSAWSSAAEGLILSCGNFRSLEVVDDIERRIGKPLLTSNQCALWSLLQRTKWQGTIPASGMLMRSLSQ